MTKDDTELKDFENFVPELVDFEEVLCSKFEETLNLNVLKKMIVTKNLSFKEVVQLALRPEN